MEGKTESDGLPVNACKEVPEEEAGVPLEQRLVV